MQPKLFQPAPHTRLVKAAASFALALSLGVSAGFADGIAALVPGSQQNFEGGGLGFTLGGTFGAGGTSDYWEVIPNDGTRVDAVTITTGGVFANASPAGGSVLAGEDTDTGGTDPVSVTFNTVNVSGLTDLSVNVLLAASNPTEGASNRGFDSSGNDFLEIQVSYDGMPFEQLAIYQPDSGFNGGLNSYLSQNGGPVAGSAATAIGQGFKNFSHALNSATTVQIRIRVSADGTGEYVAIDNFRICGNTATTETPAIAGVPTTILVYNEGDPATAIAPGITVTDDDSTEMTGATVQITSNNTPGEDLLAATGGNGVVVQAYDAATGTLTLTGTATLAAYQTALQSVTYRNSNVLNPNTATRTVTFLVTDDQSNTSNPATRNINVINSVQTFSIPHTESFDDGLGTGDQYAVLGGFDAGPNDFFRQLPAADAATRFISPIIGVVGGGFFGGEDINQNGLVDGGKVMVCLNATGLGNLSVDVLLAAPGDDFDLGDGDGLWVEYQFDNGTWNELIAFRAVAGGGALAEDTNNDNLGDGTALTTTLSNFNLPIPDTGNLLKVRVRALTGTTSEEIAFDELTVNGAVVSAPPLLSNINPGPLAYAEGDGAVVISSTATITDADDVNMESATVEISGNYVNGEDILAFTPSGGITGTFDTATGILTLTGTANLAAYETALKSVTYENTNLVAPSQNTRTVTFRVNDGDSDSNGQSSQINVIDLVTVQAMPFCESFETDGLGTRYSGNSFILSPDDFFARAAADTGDLTGSNADGTFAFIGRDTTADGNPTHSVEIVVNTAGASDLQLELKLAAVTSHFEPADTILIETEADGGGFVRLTSFHGIGVNGNLSEDTNNDGTGDGATTLGPDYTDHSYPLPDASETRIRVTINNSASDEIAAVDNICITGTDGGAPFADLADPTNGSSVESAVINAQGFIDVTFADVGFNGVDPATIDGNELSLSGDGATGVTLSGTATLVAGTTFRYGFTGAFVPGSVTVQFPAGTFADLGGTPNLLETEGFTVLNSPPVASCMNVTVNAGPDCTAPADINDGSTDPEGDTLTITQDPPGPYPLGTNLVTLAVDDGNRGNQDPPSCQALVIVVDDTAPALTCPPAQTLNASTNCTAALPDYTSFLTVSDNCDPTPSLACSPAPGTIISGAGTSITVTCQAVDASDNTNTCSFTVTLTDNTAPIITCPGDQTETASTNCDASLSDYTGLVTVTDNCDPTPVVTCDPPAGTVVAVGVTNVTCTAIDASGNSSAPCSFTVTVTDTTAPTVACPGDQTLPASTNCTAILPDYTGLVTAADHCDPDPVVTCDPPAGTLVGLGATNVTCIATDESGNPSSSCTFTVTVVDTIAPDIACPTNITVACTNFTGTVATYSPIATDNCDPSPTIACSPVSGSTFTVGSHTVTCVATDISGNTNDCSFSVIVTDAPPQILCPADLFVCTTNLSGTNVSFTVVATDACTPNPVVTCVPASGSLFPLGATRVRCQAVDSSNNTNSCLFNITVTRPFVVATQPGDIKNNFSGHVGFKITTGTNRLCVTDLGSIVVPGNTVSNTVRIFRTLDKVQIASSFVQPGGATPGSYNYTRLNAPVILNTNTMYYVVMSVTNGVNMYYDVTKTTITTTADAAPNSGIFEGSGYAWSPSGGAGQSYGVPNFKYYVITTNTPAPPPEPQIVISDPADLSTFTAPAAFTVAADTTPDVISVQFCQNGTGISVDNSFPFTVDVSNLGAGTYDYVAKGTTPQGIVITSAVVRVTVATNTPLTNACYVTNIVSLGALRNNFTGLAGKKITIGPNDLQLTHLSRYVLPGNNRPHQVKVVDAAFNDVPGASVVVPTTNCPPNQFKFSALANVVTLLAGQSYYIVSAETAGGDKFADLNSTVIQVTGVASCDGPVYFAPGAGWTTVGSSQTYGPVNFKYTIGPPPPPPTKVVNITSPANGVVLTEPATLTINASASPDIVNVAFYILQEGSSAPNLAGSDDSPPFSLTNANPLNNPGTGTHRLTVVGMDTNNCSVTSSVVTITITTNSVSTGTNCFILSRVLGDIRNDFGGWVGYKFTTGSNTISIGKLGRIISPGNSQSHTVKVVRAASPNLDLPGASVVINTSAGTPGQFKYENLANPLVLSPNTMYYLISAETIGGDTWHDVNKTVLLPAAVASINSGVYMGNNINWSLGGPSNHGYVPLDFKYAVIQQATFNAAKGGGSVEANVTPTLQCQPGPDGMAVTIKGTTGMKVSLQASNDLVHWKTIATHTMERDELRIADVEGVQSHRFYRLR